MNSPPMLKPLTENIQKDQLSSLVTNNNCDKPELLKPALSSEVPITLTNDISTIVNKTKTRVIPLVCQPSGMKVSTSTAPSSTNQQIYVGSLSTLNKLNIQKSATLTPVSIHSSQSLPNRAQSFVLQKSANSAMQTLLPLSGSKSLHYVGAFIKQTGTGKTEQVIIPTNQLPPGLNQKLVLTPLVMPKLTTKLPNPTPPEVSQSKVTNVIVPVSIPQVKNGSQSMINIKISNGQLHSDPNGLVTVIGESKMTAREVESKVNTKANSELDRRALADKTYELSIPEDVSKCGFSYTIAIPEDDKILVTPKEHKKQHEVSILKKASADRVVVKSEVEKKPEKGEEITVTAETPKPVERRRKSQYTYLKDYDEVVVTSGNAWESNEKHFQNADITLTKLPPEEEEVKKEPKKLEDFVEIEVVKQESIPADDYDIEKALDWRDGVGSLPGSDLKFQVNEFGIIEMMVKDEWKKVKKEETDWKTEMKEYPPDEILCCNECGCYGMPSEFVSQNFCSFECKMSNKSQSCKKDGLVRRYKKRKRKFGYLQRLQRKRALETKTNEETQQMSVGPPSTDSAMMTTTTPQSEDDNTSTEAPQDQYPWKGGKHGFSWSKYLDHIKAKAAPVKLFKDPFPYNKNGFRPGMKLEGVDPQHPSYYCVLTVAAVIGYRIRLHFDGFSDNYDFWVNADSMNVFPAGWCEKFNHILHPPPDYDPVDFSWPSYLKQCKTPAAPKHLFTNRVGNAICPNGFRLGMKLEAVDKKNTNLVCVATVSDLMDNRFLVHFDSWDDMYDYWADPTSPYIHPVGWCDQNGHKLTPPSSYSDPEAFSWERYLKETRSVPAPARAFKQRPGNGFRKGMRLECVDPRVPSLIRVATVDSVKEHQIRISFDGWQDKYSFWVDDDSPDIHPVGWCQKTGHPLESPLTQEDVFENMECAIIGCKGIGNIKGLKYSTHSTVKYCPYADENLNAEAPFPDRLLTVGAHYLSEAIVPLSREPREKTKQPSVSPKLEKPVKRKPEGEDWITYEPSKKVKTEDISPVFSSSKFMDEINGRLIGKPDYPNPSQHVWAKHSKYLSEFITNSSNPILWNEDEVVEFVSSLPSCKDHGILFHKHRIDGESFLMLTQQDLVDILGIKLGPAIKLYNSIVLLRQSVSSRC